jgi:hypothetical protein
VLLAAPRLVSGDTIVPILEKLEAAARARDTARSLELIRTLVPEYQVTASSAAPSPARAIN